MQSSPCMHQASEAPEMRRSVLRGKDRKHRTTQEHYLDSWGQLGGCESLQQGAQLPARRRSYVVGGEDLLGRENS